VTAAQASRKVPIQCAVVSLQGGIRQKQWLLAEEISDSAAANQVAGP